MKSKNHIAYHYIFLLFILVLLPFSRDILAQPSAKEIRTIFNEAESILLYNEDYEEALPLYRMLTDLVPGNHNYQYKTGICYLNIAGKIDKALPWLKKANVDPVIDYSYSYKEDHAPVDVIFYIGSAYHILGQTDSAVIYYKKFLQATSRYQNTGMFYNEFVRQQIKNCEHVSEMKKEPVRIRTARLPDLINAYHKNLYPVMSGNRQVLVYTAYPGHNHRILCSRKTPDGWGEPEDITDQLEAGEDCYTTALSYAGDELFIYKEEGGQADLWSSHYDGSAWSPMKRLDRTINTKYWESSCYLTPNGKQLYFTSNRDGGYGGLDIYVSRRTADGHWGPAVNLGSVINTPLMEDFPYLSEDGKKLFFTSQGHYNAGSFDIFYSVRKGSRWTHPFNVGYPVNTSDENRFFYPLGKGDTALISLFTREEGDPAGNWDIFKVHILSKGEIAAILLKGSVSFADGSETPDTSLYVTVTDSAGKPVERLRPDMSGHYTCDLLPGTYNVSVHSRKYNDTTRTISIPPDYPLSSLALETRLTPRAAGKGDIFFIRSVYFSPNSTNLTPMAREALAQVAVMLKEYPSLRFEIGGLTDTTGTQEYKESQPVQRALAVLDYLDSLGVPKTKIRFTHMADMKVVPLGKGKATRLADMEKGSRRVDIKLIRPDTTLKMKEEYFVPEYLKGKNNLTYSILVIKTKKKLPADYFYRYNIEELSYVKVDEVNGEYYYTLGSFKQKARAVEMLNKIIEIGFSKARILDDPSLEDLLKQEKPPQKEYVGRSEYIKEEIPYYTIQIYALYKPPYKGAFRGLKDIQVWPSKDRFIRYTTGNYHGYSKALADLPKIRKMGFFDAFIRPVSSLKELLKEQ